MTKLTDYTTGSLYKHLCFLSLPLIAGNILQQLYNTIDAVIIGRYASFNEFAAIGVASAFMNIFLFCVIGGCSGISIIFAQTYGSHDLKKFRQFHFESLVIGIVISLILGILGFIFLEKLLYLIKTPIELISFAKCYLTYVLLGLFISFLYNLYASLLQSVGKARVALYSLFIAVISNLILDMFFISHLKMGIEGAAIATMISQLISVVILVIYIKTKLPLLWFSKNDCVFNKNQCRRILKFSFVTSIHQVGLYIGKLFVQGTVNNAGTDMICAYTATTRIEGFANSFGDSGSTATSILAAQNLGADNKKRVRQTFYVSLVVLIIFGLLSSFIMYITAKTTVAFLLNGEQSVAYDNAVMYLKIISIFYIFCFTGNTFAGFLNGIGRVNIPFIGAASHITLRVILSLMWVPIMGLSGVAIATGIGWVLVNIFWSLIILKLKLLKF